MKVVALNRFEYANKLRVPGDEFDTTSDKDAEILQLAQQVKLAPAKAAPLETRALKAEEPKEEATPDPKKKRYMRRDMRPEE